jgi:hypothetical protein
MKYFEQISVIVRDDDRHVLVEFVPNETIAVDPPYVKGKRDRKWILYNPSRIKYDVGNKATCESIIGMTLQPL